jgi:P63C domain
MAKKIVKAEYGSSDRPLKIGRTEIPCYVLEDGRRVLVQNGMLTALDMSQGTAAKGAKGDRLAKFLGTRGIKPLVNEELENVITNPVRFRTPTGSDAYGYEATILPDICDAVLEARTRGTLHRQQEHIAKACEILVRSFAKVGIIALVDEATGFQYVRDREALVEILEKFLSDELLKWTKTFPDEFYENLFRLRGWRYSPFTVKRPALVGKLTNQLVYERLAPGVLDELKRKNPKDVKGRRKNRHHQWLTDDIGHPKLREHIASVTTLMKASTKWDDFKRMINRALPKWEDMPLFDKPKEK